MNVHVCHFEALQQLSGPHLGCLHIVTSFLNIIQINLCPLSVHHALNVFELVSLHLSVLGRQGVCFVVFLCSHFYLLRLLALLLFLVFCDLLCLFIRNLFDLGLFFVFILLLDFLEVFGLIIFVCGFGFVLLLLVVFLGLFEQMLDPFKWVIVLHQFLKFRDV